MVTVYLASMPNVQSVPIRLAPKVTLWFMTCAPLRDDLI